MSSSSCEIWTVGHSTRAIADFIAILKSFRTEALADVRSYPASRRHPQFNQEALADALGSAGIEYLHLRELGGRRKPIANSPNTAWQNLGFRGYADYMQTEEFRSGIRRLLEVARLKRTATMCAEAVWWRCHRSLISDYLKAGGVTVTHILANGRSEPHAYTSAASVVDGELSYRGLF